MKVTIFDTETTGLIINPARKLDKQPEVISIAICDVDLASGLISNEYYQEFKPQNSITQEITDITKFTNEYLSTKNHIFHYMEEITQRLENPLLLIGQNINFDMSILNFECQRYWRPIKWPKTLDLIENTIYLKGYRLSLTNLHLELFHTTFEDAHHALTDAKITAKCAIELFKRRLL